MNERNRFRMWAIGAVVTVLVGACMALLGAAPLAFGIICGGLWNLASLWCLTQLLDAWLGPHPSRRRAVLWLLVKFPLLYLLIFTALRQPAIALAGFGIGFTLVLVAAVGVLASSAQRRTTVRANGR